MWTLTSAVALSLQGRILSVVSVRRTGLGERAWTVLEARHVTFTLGADENGSPSPLHTNYRWHRFGTPIAAWCAIVKTLDLVDRSIC
ncbi:hypothetical protein MTO96_014231 [Rhipicephalus appendiculatus]